MQAWNTKAEVDRRGKETSSAEKTRFRMKSWNANETQLSVCDSLDGDKFNLRDHVSNKPFFGYNNAKAKKLDIKI